MNKYLLPCLIVLIGTAYAQNSKQPPATTFTEIATIAGRQTTFGQLYALQTDCSPVDWVEIIIVQPPKFGSYEVAVKNVAASYADNNSRKVCNGKQVPAKYIAYTPLEQAQGKDFMIVDRVTSEGFKSRIQYNISIVKVPQP